jgi:hypothetical protein
MNTKSWIPNMPMTKNTVVNARIDEGLWFIAVAVMGLCWKCHCRASVSPCRNHNFPTLTMVIFDIGTVTG